MSALKLVFLPLKHTKHQNKVRDGGQETRVKEENIKQIKKKDGLTVSGLVLSLHNTAY
jgi:hypothetical protein